MTILEDARQFIFDQFNGQEYTRETRHPWRNNWEFAFLHSLRVEALTVQILAREQHGLSAHEVELIRLAAILHDVARMGERENHAQIGAEVAGKWLEGRPSLDGRDIQTVTGMIANHSSKGQPASGYPLAVLQDADTLDEIGVMSIFMSSNWLDKQSPFFFHHLRQSLMEQEIPYCDKKLGILNTQGAREILQEKKAFLENFAAQIASELDTHPDTHQILPVAPKGRRDLPSLGRP